MYDSGGKFMHELTDSPMEKFDESGGRLMHDLIGGPTHVRAG